MGTLWRSEEMQLVQLYVQIEAARDTVDELGNLGLIQFRDMNAEDNAFQRNFVNEVKRFDQMERKVRFFEEQVQKANLGPLTGLPDQQPPEPTDEPSSKVMIDELEAKFDELEKELLQMNNNQETLDRNYNELVELEYVLENNAFFFDEQDLQRAEQDETQLGGAVRERLREDERSPLVHIGDSKFIRSSNLGFITGVILREKLPPFERVLWRATRGNLFMKQLEIEKPIKDPHTGLDVEKNVFIIFFQGERTQMKIKKICESFGANLYRIPDTPQSRAESRAQIASRLADLRLILDRTQEHSRRVLNRVAINLENWKAQVLKEKSIYHTMNLFNYDVGRKCLIAEGWCPTTATEDIQLALRRATTRSGALVPSILTVVASQDTPPTYFKLNKFTQSFQSIIDAYGVPDYMEINPCVFTIVTFPFLFGVMFGDFGHGLFLTAFAALLVWKEKQLAQIKLNEMVKTCYDGRYIILLMGIFATYVGLIYNECFAVPFNIFGSYWQVDPNNPHNPALVKSGRQVYLFGVDPAWKNAKNDLTFYNSLKMKLSIILGLTQMMLGLILKALNARHFKKPYDLWFEFIPMFTFMGSVFGYMVFLIFFKWVKPFPHQPSILNLMIQMFLSPTHLDPRYNLLGPVQLPLQAVLIIVAIISVPMMLLPKPFLLRRDHKLQLAQKGYEAVHDDDENEEEFEFGEIIVHQAIHTIEFVLGAISNTASYLRLWALSLAHAELSKVFWEMVLVRVMALHGGGQFIFMFIGFAVWAAMTFLVLMLMESLSAFLHSLRLHWVEFQNKFFGGTGYKFAPFSYSSILHPEED